jgi:hypothetical protein
MTSKIILEGPILIYDNNCSPCWKYAKIARRLSRGRIRLLGHYDVTDELHKIKEVVFPAGYDPTIMSWLINNRGAYGGRAWVLPLTREIILGLLFGSSRDTTKLGVEKAKENNNIVACSRNQGWFQRMSYFLKKTKRFTF